MGVPHRQSGSALVRSSALLALLLGGCHIDPSDNAAYRAECDPDARFMGFCIMLDVADAGTLSVSAGDAAGPSLTDERDDERGNEGDDAGDAGAHGNATTWAPPAPSAPSDAGAMPMVNAPACVEGSARSCYPGGLPPVLLGLCSPGLETCRDGVWDACKGYRLPAAAETCNGADDDCDAALDEEVASQSCATALPGRCQAGESRCGPGGRSCVALLEPEPERCNGEDDDCDGSLDEQTAETCFEGTRGCDTVDGVTRCVGTCELGVRVCDDGVLAQTCAGAVLPAPGDGCNFGNWGFDDDCDGSVDEDCACVSGLTRDCFGGPPTARFEGTRCQQGTASCYAGRFGDCVGDVLPVAETCDNEGQDDDCDGKVDEVSGRGVACIDDSRDGVCRAGTLDCVAGTLACATEAAASTELCDGLDNDCDGRIDEAFDLFTDEAHCGLCERACDAGDSCCRGGCVDVQRNAADCGACGHRCAAGLGCCDGGCVDLSSDEASCGACGNVCRAGTSCCGGQCVASDPEHCGASCAACEGDSLCCSDRCVPRDASHCSACDESCGAAEQCCGAAGCRDLSSDPEHCGACETPTPAAAVCSEGHACGAGEVYCQDDAECVRLDTDEDHCGSCNNRCGGRKSCASGVCVMGGEE